MKAFLLIPAALLLAACSGPEDGAETAEAPAPDDGRSNLERELDGLYDQERVDRRNELLASSDACFAEDRAALLNENQTLMERGALAIDIIAHAVDGEREVFEFPIVELSQDQRERLNAAAADFYRAAGEVHDYDTDDTIYHRDQSGTNCTVVKDPAIGRPLVETARAIAQERAG
jgi:hypothetical protein